MTLSRSLILALAAGSLMAQNKPAEAPAGPRPKPGSVDGAVTNGLTKQPVNRAVVYLRGAAQGAAYAATTDAAGHFHIDGVTPAKSYFVTAERPGFSPDPHTVANPTGIPVAPAQAVTGVNLILTPQAVITGRVLDAEGDPLAGAVVQAFVRTFHFGVMEMEQRQSAVSDDRGIYRLFDLDPDRYYLRVSARRTELQGGARSHHDRPEEVYAPAYYPGVAELTEAKPVEVAAGSTAAGTEFRLHPTRLYSIRGKVTDNGTGVASTGTLRGARCAEDRVQLPTAIDANVQADGTFDLGPVAPGIYCLTAQGRKPDRLSAAHFTVAHQTVEVKDRDLGGITMALILAIDVQGKIVFSGPPPADADSLRVALSPTLSADLKADHTFLIPNVFPGHYHAQVTGLNGAYLKSISVNDHEAADGDLTIAPGVVLSLVIGNDPGQVKVSVRPSAGPTASLIFAAPAGNLSSRDDLFTYSDAPANGTASITGLAPGEYYVFAWEKPDYELARLPAIRKLLENRATRITVHANGHESAQVPLVTAEEIDAAKARLR